MRVCVRRLTRASRLACGSGPAWTPLRPGVGPGLTRGAAALGPAATPAVDRTPLLPGGPGVPGWTAAGDSARARAQISGGVRPSGGAPGQRGAKKRLS